MAYNRADIRAEVRDEINEAVADMISDAVLNRHIKREINGLPRKGVYLEELWTANTVVDQQDYTLPTGTYKAEKVERNYGTASQPDWQEVKGMDQYAGALFLSQRPVTSWSIRVHLRKAFTALSDDVASSDVPDEKMEVVILGAALRCYRTIIGYMKNARNWDSIAKPSGVDMNNIQRWYGELKQDYKDAIQNFKTYPRPREIDLVG